MILGFAVTATKMALVPLSLKKPPHSPGVEVSLGLYPHLPDKTAAWTASFKSRHRIRVRFVSFGILFLLNRANMAMWK